MDKIEEKVFELTNKYGNSDKDLESHLYLDLMELVDVVAMSLIKNKNNP